MRDWEIEEIEEIERGVCFVFMAVRWKEKDYLWRSARLRDICRNEAHADCGLRVWLKGDDVKRATFVFPFRQT
jgi:hypothetical protein